MGKKKNMTRVQGNCGPSSLGKQITLQTLGLWPEEGAIALQNRQWTVPLGKTENRVSKVKNTQPLQGCEFGCWSAPSWSHQPWATWQWWWHSSSSGPKLSSTIPYPQPLRSHTEAHLLSLCQGRSHLWQRPSLCPSSQGRSFCLRYSCLVAQVENTPSIIHQHRWETFIFISCHLDFRVHFTSHFTRHLRKLLHASWAVRWTCLR